jgi:hypothetical protein
MSAACRSSSGGLAICYTRFQKVESRCYGGTSWFQIETDVVKTNLENPKSCWNSFIGDFVIAQGFRIADRDSSMMGLAIPLEIMAALAGVPLATKFNDGLILKGRHHAFIPIQKVGNAVQWHVYENESHRIRYEEVDKKFPRRLRLSELNESHLMSTRAFLGWCVEPFNFFGTFLDLVIPNSH